MTLFTGCRNFQLRDTELWKLLWSRVLAFSSENGKLRISFRKSITSAADIVAQPDSLMVLRPSVRF